MFTSTFCHILDQFILASGNPDCEKGTAKQLKYFGNIPLEECKTKCLELRKCTDIIWAPGNQACKAFDGCEGAGRSSRWQHYSLAGM